MGLYIDLYVKMKKGGGGMGMDSSSSSAGGGGFSGGGGGFDSPDGPDNGTAEVALEH